MYINYASALYSLAEDMGLEEKVLVQMKEIDKALSDNPDFEVLLDSHAVSCAERLSAADSAFDGAEEILVSFIKILTEKHLVYIFGKCTAAYRKEYNKKHGISYVTAETAVPLSAELSELIREKLENSTGKRIILENRVNTEILGGMVLKTEGKEIDASLLKKLRDMGDSRY